MPDFHAEIHWQLADGDRVTTYKTYHGTHLGEFFGVAPTGRKIQFEDVRELTPVDEELWSLKVVMAKTRLSRSTLYAYIAIGAFPTQRRLGTRRVAWFASEVRKWIANRRARGVGTTF